MLDRDEYSSEVIISRILSANRMTMIVKPLNQHGTKTIFDNVHLVHQPVITSTKDGNN